MPLSFGAVQAWSEYVVITAVSLIALLFCCKLIIYPQERIIRTWAYIPLAIFIIIAAAQLIPLPGSIVGIISPNTLELRSQLIGDIPGSESYLKWMPLSLYPAATKHDLRLVLAAATVFVVVLNVFRRPEQMKRLLLSIAIIGGAVALITLAQNIFGNGKIYWFIQTPNSQGYSGPFVNHSNYGQFINLSIAAAIAVLLVRLREMFKYSGTSVPLAFDYIGSPAARGIWLLIGIIGICVATLFLSLTRGGIISMLAAAAFTAIMISRTGTLKKQAWLFVFIFLIAFGCVLYAGFDAVCERLVTVRNLGQGETGRIQIIKDIAVCSKEFPLFGTGLGTHRYVYPMFDRSLFVLPAYHADNEYAQAIEETGFVGLAALLVFAFVIGKGYWRAIRNKNNIIFSAAFGIGFGILAILIHSMTDFGQHLPANGLLTAALCALLLVLAGQKQKNYGLADFKIKNSKWPRLLTGLIVLSICIWAVSNANRSRIAENQWQKVRALSEQIERNQDVGIEYAKAKRIHYAESAAENDPDNIFYRYLLNVYRYGTLGGTRDPYSDELTIGTEQIPDAYEIVEQLEKICMQCPTYGPAYSMLGQIQKFVLYDDDGAEHIRKSYRLAKNDPVICFVAGCLDASEGEVDCAAGKFARAVKLDGRLYDKAALVFIDRLSRPDLAIEIAGQNVAHLNSVYSVLNDAFYTDYACQVQEQIISIIEKERRDGTATAWETKLLGEYYYRQGQNQKAIECYRQALRMDYKQVGWRYDLAFVLAECNKPKEAMDEARVCLQLRPEFTEAKNLLARCSVHPSVLNQSVNQN
jgi:O-antigen ligase